MKKMKALTNWTVHLTGKNIFVEGFFDDDGELWHSSVITECEGTHCVKTISGSKYMLLGNLDIKRARQEKVPDEFINVFATGFPPNWRSVVQDVVSRHKVLSSLKTRSSTKKSGHNMFSSSSESAPTVVTSCSDAVAPADHVSTSVIEVNESNGTVRHMASYVSHSSNVEQDVYNLMPVERESVRNSSKNDEQCEVNNVSPTIVETVSNEPAGIGSSTSDGCGEKETVDICKGNVHYAIEPVLRNNEVVDEGGRCDLAIRNQAPESCAGCLSSATEIVAGIDCRSACCGLVDVRISDSTKVNTGSISLFTTNSQNKLENSRSVVESVLLSGCGYTKKQAVSLPALNAVAASSKDPTLAGKRSSSRQRLAPLKWWTNERQLTSPRDGTVIVLSGTTTDALDCHQMALQKSLSSNRCHRKKLRQRCRVESNKVISDSEQTESGETSIKVIGSSEQAKRKRNNRQKFMPAARGSKMNAQHDHYCPSKGHTAVDSCGRLEVDEQTETCNVYNSRNTDESKGLHCDSSVSAETSKQSIPQVHGLKKGRAIDRISKNSGNSLDLDVILTPISSGKKRDGHRLKLAFAMASPAMISQTSLPPNDVELDVIDRSFFDREDKPKKRSRAINRGNDYLQYSFQCDGIKGPVCNMKAATQKSSMKEKSSANHVPVSKVQPVLDLMDTPTSMIHSKQDDGISAPRPVAKKRRTSRKVDEKVSKAKKCSKKEVVKFKKIVTVGKGKKQNASQGIVNAIDVDHEAVQRTSDDARRKKITSARHGKSVSKKNVAPSNTSEHQLPPVKAISRMALEINNDAVKARVKKSRTVSNVLGKECQSRGAAEKVKKTGGTLENSEATVKLTGSNNGLKLTAGRGTLKRKRILQEMIAQHELRNRNDDEMDLFTSTPFRVVEPAKVSKFLNCSIAQLDVLSLGLSASSSRANSCLTPHGLYKDPVTPNNVSSGSTPRLLTQTVNRNDVDTYIHRAQKKKVYVNRKSRKNITKLQPVFLNTHPAPALPRDVFAVIHESDENDNNSSFEMDDYFDDI